jgi:hypothetical protein
MKISIELSADQLKLINDLVTYEKCQISGDIDEEESELSPSSFAVLTVRFWQLETIHKLLNAYQTTTTTGPNEN